ncbi:hypothetical protein GOP47_0015814 [Adiantum capillus-veneris]|uniref:Uncharacterized protein n=1 Tax=Adiantum capillus-veneris TaxID=13818 RepID=A0A9D4ULJ0_ADICA|nr:hypothetical protein GOP47_0015814 [Adiantum capillus-veneris]
MLCTYKVPLIVLSQLLYPAKYTKALQSADKKGRKDTQRASAIADPNLGEEWWRLLMDIDWSRRPKWLTDDRIYSLACAKLLNNHRSNHTFPPNKREQFREAEVDRVKRQQEEGKNLRSLKGKDVVTEETHNEEEEEEDREPRRNDGECPLEFEDDEDESDVPPSPTAKPTRAPQSTQESNAKKDKGQDSIHSKEMPTIIGLPHDANGTITKVSTILSTVAEAGHCGEPALLVGDVMV